MKTFEEFIDAIPDPENQHRFTQVIEWVKETYPQLEMRMAWNQPMFTDHGTYIIGFSVSAKHMAFAPERATMIHFEDEIKASGLSHGSMIIRSPWDKPFNFELLGKMIDYNIKDKKDTTTFWRKE